MADSFGFKKSKGRRNMRQRENAFAGDPLADEAPVDIVKRSSKTANRVSTPISAMSSMSVGSETTNDSLAVQKTRSSLQFKSIVEEAKYCADSDKRTYSSKELEELKKSAAKPKDLSENNKQEENKPYPFSNEGIPDAQEIYMAKKLRRQRQAVLAAEQSNPDSRSLDNDMDVDYSQSRNTEDFLSLNSGIKTSFAAGKRNNNVYGQEDEDGEDYEDVPSKNIIDDPFGGGMAEGEDEMDTLIVDKTERAAFKQTTRNAMKESVELAQEDDESSDWEKEQLRNAGISLNLKKPRSTAAPKLPEDTGGFSFDDAFMKLVIDEEENQLKIEEDRLEKLQAHLQRSKEKALAIQDNLKQAETQLGHFSSMAKTIQQQQ